MSQFGHLIPQGGGDVIPLVRSSLTIGRRESCDICLRFPNVSGTHCKLDFTNGCWMAEDLGSKNGIKVNGDRVQKRILHPGDILSVGKHDYVIQYNLSASQEVLDRMSEEMDGIISQPLMEKAGLVRPPRESSPRESSPRTPAKPGSGRLNLPPLVRDDDFEDDD